MANKLNGLFYGKKESGTEGAGNQGVVMRVATACTGALVEMMRTPIYGSGPRVAPLAGVCEDEIEVVGRKRDLPTMFGCPRGF